MACYHHVRVLRSHSFTRGVRIIVGYIATFGNCLALNAPYGCLICLCGLVSWRKCGLGEPRLGADDTRLRFCAFTIYTFVLDKDLSHSPKCHALVPHIMSCERVVYGAHMPVLACDIGITRGNARKNDT